LQPDLNKTPSDKTGAIQGVGFLGVFNVPMDTFMLMLGSIERKKLLRIMFVAVSVAAAGFLGWQHYGGTGREEGIASGNGRIEAVEIDIATRSPGRVKEIKVAEGDFVVAGQVLAIMDTDVLEAQLRQAQAQWQQMRSATAMANSQLQQRESEKLAAQAALEKSAVELKVANSQLSRTLTLVDKGYVSEQTIDDLRARVDAAQASVSAARAQVAATEAGIASARSQIENTRSSTAAAQANIERIQADIDDAVLKSPCDGRVQYIVARASEVLGGGGKVLNLVDLSDVYMTFFLPETLAGRVAIGSEARLVLDVAPDYVVPATVTFVASSAQFTPKTVETASERQKLMFRVKAQINRELLLQNLEKVKTGLPGVAWVKIDDAAQWPARLAIKVTRTGEDRAQ
jgi:HlyD family secretion protein